MVKWKANQTEQWKGVFPEGCGYAAIMGNLTGYIVVDTDTEASEKFIKAQVPETGIMVKTRKGFHRYYKWPESGAQTLLRFDRYKGADLKADRSYVLIPPTKNYEWMSFDPTKVPPFDFKWLNISQYTSVSSTSRINTLGIGEVDRILLALRECGGILSKKSGSTMNIYVRTCYEILMNMGYAPDESKAGPMKSINAHINGMLLISPSGLTFLSNAGGIFCKIILNLRDQIKLYQTLQKED